MLLLSAATNFMTKCIRSLHSWLILFSVCSGLSSEGIDLLQYYVDVSSDVQTAAVLAIQALASSDVSRDARVCNWLETYRSLLDHWGLWIQR